MVRTRGPGRRAVANATVTPAVEYAGDPYAEPRLHALQDEIAMRLQGYGSGVYGVANGDPSASFNGYAAPIQTFGPVSTQANPIAYRDPAGATLETGLTDGAYSDPARRIFAQRLVRRGSMT